MNGIYNDLCKLEYLFGVGLLCRRLCRRTMTADMYTNDIVDIILPQFQVAIGENFASLCKLVN
jgi:hypothetical protein